MAQILTDQRERQKSNKNRNILLLPYLVARNSGSAELPLAYVKRRIFPQQRSCNEAQCASVSWRFMLRSLGTFRYDGFYVT